MLFKFENCAKIDIFLQKQKKKIPKKRKSTSTMKMKVLLY